MFPVQLNKSSEIARFPVILICRCHQQYHHHHHHHHQHQQKIKRTMEVLQDSLVMSFSLHSKRAHVFQIFHQRRFNKKNPFSNSNGQPQALRCVAQTFHVLGQHPSFAARGGYDHVLLYGVEYLRPQFCCWCQHGEPRWSPSPGKKNGIISPLRMALKNR